MKQENIIKKKSYALAISVINLCLCMSRQHKDPFLTRQLLRSGTSIGANVREALAETTHRDVVYKMSIALKEAKETAYLLHLMRDTKLIRADTGAQLLKDTGEIVRLLSKMLITSRAGAKSHIDN
ncbi:MAG: four helix bundle protein [Bacteroidales bacterium]|nr:four helix bundle protein [Bacteroidales bacterium]